MNITPLGRAVATERVKAGMSLWAMSQETRLSEFRIAQIEQGEATEITQRELYLLDKTFGLGMPALFHWAHPAHSFSGLTPPAQGRYYQLMGALEQVFGDRPYVFKVATDAEDVEDADAESDAEIPAENLFCDGSCVIVIANCHKRLRVRISAYGCGFIAGESTVGEYFLHPAISPEAFIFAARWMDKRA